MNDTKTCPKCEHAMNPGFIAKRSLEGSHVVQWVEGEPERSLWSHKLPPEKSWPVTTYRCVSCGYVEAYALR